MVIDTRTGMGCAWGICSKTITQQLVEDGIVGKTIFILSRNERLHLIQVVAHRRYIYVCAQKYSPENVEPLWYPSFIQKEVWQQAVSQFIPDYTLSHNVEKYLLPVMDEYFNNISEIELIAQVKMFLIERRILDCPIRSCKKKTYYFNKNEIYSIDKNSKIFPYEGRLKFRIFKILDERYFNMRVWTKAVTQFKVGMTLDECIMIFLKTRLIFIEPEERTPFEILVQLIKSPVYERIPENQDPSTFDRIRVVVCLPRYHFSSWQELRAEVKKYRHEIFRKAFQMIAEDRNFKKYQIPIHCIKLSNAILLRDFSLELIFEPKTLSSYERKK